jgi:tetratricopeptide (TPR) repeat protein
MVQTTRITLRERIQNIEDAISAGQIDEAMEQCQQILARYPDALEIQRLLGEVYLAQGHLDEAQQSFDWILVNDPENVIVYCDRALISEHQSDIDTALDCYQQAYELSRGNSQIRHEFNTLSAKVGQQEFMFSRAGLARLYMRGNLLTQAIQEWEAVLSTSPDRMDARLGLLETYWRDNQYNEVERMASRILEEVPHCLKALLLVAHVASAYNMQRARDLVTRAEKLDPELLFAQDLFSDLAASQPNDPFLVLVKKEPITLHDEELNGKEKSGDSIDAISTSQYVAVEIEPVSSDDEGSPDRVYNWNGMDSWSELDTRSVPKTTREDVQDQPGEPLTALDHSGNGNGNGNSAKHASVELPWSDDANIKQVETWSTRGEPERPEQPGHQEQNIITDDFEVWATQQEIDDDFDPSLLEQQPWFQAEQSSGNAAEFAIPEPEAPTDIASWHSASRREAQPTPPAWLDMLTQSDQTQPGESFEPEQTLVPQTHDTSSFTQDDEQDALPSFFFSPSSKDEDEEDMGWPEWLKSLGAESIDSGHESAQPSLTPSSGSYWNEFQQASELPVMEQTAEIEPTIGQQPPVEQESTAPAGEQEAWAAPDLSLQEAEAHYVTTLEALEQSLRSHGFTPLQPGSLASIAQQESPTESAQPATTKPATPTQPLSPVSKPQEIAPDAEPTFVEAAQEVVTEPEAVLAEEESQISRTPTAPLPVEEVEPESPPSVAEQVEQDGTTHQVEPAEVKETAVSTEQGSPSTAPAPRIETQPQKELVPLAPLDLEALLDSELETTMRRPAVRLQPMQPAAGQAGPPSSVGKKLDLSGQAQDGKLSNKERLVKGYQFQLAGAYDDAMQEYRALIRNAPELLGDVISNVRALLKLAPRYTAGYRVLGDAYMRQGEYLQAMEAYNKALTIAKKAKSLAR